ncbi:MAG: single-stranded DNA-binding protein [bacterium]
MSRSVNLAILIGNLTRDPEMKYTPKGTAVTTFGVATNRVYTTADGEQKEEADFHNVVSWGKLAEICNQYLRKGRKVYIKGRIQSSSWQTQEGQRRTRVEIVADDMIILDSKRVEDYEKSAPAPSASAKPSSEDVNPEDIAESVADAVGGEPAPF